MDFENERVLKLIFPKGIPENLRDNPQLSEYLYKLGQYKVEELKKEEARLSDENKSVIEHTQDLAITNYKTFIQTAECSKEIYREFLDTEQKLDGLIGKLPNLQAKCEAFVKTSSDINHLRRLNSVSLKKNAQLLEILELPQLMDGCIKDGKYEEALELAAYVQRLGVKHGNIPVINSIVQSIESSWHIMLKQLLAQLKTDLQLPKCLQVVGYLRRMQAFTSAELKIIFLQARDSWLCGILANIPCDDAQQHLTKTIELTRVNLFNIITQYKATFAEDDGPKDGQTENTSSVFYRWLHKKIEIFLETVESDLQQGVNSIDTILGQCMYFGLSFSRVGADFRTLLIPIFTNVILSNFDASVFKVTRQFEQDLENYTLINKVQVAKTSSAAATTIADENSTDDNLSPPESLLDYHPLAIYCNGLLTTFNDLRHCCPIALCNDITECIQRSLESIARNILQFYRQEQQAFSAIDRDCLIKFCACFAYDLVPYMQRSIHVLFAPAVIADHLGINVMQLQKDGLTYLKQKQITEVIDHLLPDRIDPVKFNLKTTTDSVVAAKSVEPASTVAGAEGIEPITTTS